MQKIFMKIIRTKLISSHDEDPQRNKLASSTADLTAIFSKMRER